MRTIGGLVRIDTDSRNRGELGTQLLDDLLRRQIALAARREANEEAALVDGLIAAGSHEGTEDIDIRILGHDGANALLQRHRVI